MLEFTITAESSQTRARTGRMQTRRGTVVTPIFMPVGTAGSVKAVSPEDLVDCGAQIILGNTYHLYLRPGCEVIDEFDGLHRFMNWHGPVLTDSGGFQIFSLAKISRVTENGFSFQSHIDGSPHLITPEDAVAIQTRLGADIIMCLDQCISYPATETEAKNALDLTTRWAHRCRAAWEEGRSDNALFGIVQGGCIRRFGKNRRKRLSKWTFPAMPWGD